MQAILGGYILSMNVEYYLKEGCWGKEEKYDVKKLKDKGIMQRDGLEVGWGMKSSGVIVVMTSGNMLKT
jgi:hypothetical protein